MVIRRNLGMIGTDLEGNYALTMSIYYEENKSIIWNASKQKKNE